MNSQTWAHMVFGEFMDTKHFLKFQVDRRPGSIIIEQHRALTVTSRFGLQASAVESTLESSKTF